MKKKLAMFMAVVMIMTAAIAGTLAWLQAESSEVTNTFTFGDINIVLDESKLNTDGSLNVSERVQGNEYKTIPGAELAKDPVVTVEKGSEACWLFVKVTENGAAVVKGKDAEGSEISITYNFDDFFSYTIDSAQWEALGEDYPGIYYYIGTDLDVSLKEDVKVNILLDTKITVKDSVTKEMINNITDTPQLIFTAYAIQKDVSITDAKAAWKLITGSN